MLWSQVQLCRRSLSAMAGAAGVERLGELRSVPAVELLEEVAARLRSVRPDVALNVSIHIDDTEWKMSLVPKKLRRKIDRAHGPDGWDPEDAPLPRYQMQVHLRGVPHRRLHVPGLDD